MIIDTHGSLCNLNDRLIGNPEQDRGDDGYYALHSHCDRDEFRTFLVNNRSSVGGVIKPVTMVMVLCGVFVFVLSLK